MPRLAVDRIHSIRKLAVYFANAITVIACLVIPEQTQHLNFRAISEPLEIQIDKSSPALSALEDTKISFNTEKIPTIDMKSQVIAAGTKRFSNKVDAELASVGPTRVIELNPQIISGKTVAFAEESLSSDPYTLAKAYLQQNPQAPSFDEVAKALVEAELKRRKLESLNARVINTESGSNIIVSRTGMPQEPNKAASPGLPPRRPIEKQYAANYKKNNRNNLNNEKSKQETLLAGNANQKPTSLFVADIGGARADLFSEKFTEDVKVPARGHISFQGGSAYINGYDQLVIYHGFGDLILGEGQWIEKNQNFVVDVTEPKGEIWAKVYSQDGVLTAEGVVYLADLRTDWSKTKKIEEIEIQVKPAVDFTEAIVVSADSIGSKIRKPILNAEVEVPGFGRATLEEKTGINKITDLVRPSSFLLEASLENFWPTMKFALAGQKSFMNIFSNKYVSALSQAVDQDARGDLKNQSLAWGQVMSSGRPVQNAVVDLAFQNSKKVIYFSGPFPDQYRMMTSENGQFAILGEGSGLELLRVQQLGEKILPTMIGLQAGYVTDLNIDIQAERQYEIQVYDAIGKRPQPAELNALGEEEFFTTNDVGYTSIRRKMIRGISLLEADPGTEFMMSRVNFYERTSLIHVPVLRITWLQKLYAEANLPKTVDTSKVIFGLVSGDNFEVSLADYSVGKDYGAVLYTNPDGSLRPEKFGVADGGYLILGAPEGLNTVIISSERSNKKVSSLVLVDKRAAQVLITSLLN